MDRAVLYARVSSEEQVEGYSIDAQRRAFRDLCKSKGWTPLTEYVDEGKSAHRDNADNRPAFKRMIADAERGKFDFLVVHKLDRFSRNLRTTLEYFDKLLKCGASFVSISEQMDFTTPSGKVLLALVGAFAEYYSDNLSHETKKGWAERRKQGLYCGLLPFGAVKGENGVPIPHPDAYPGLLMAFDLAAQGKTDREVATALNSAGYQTAGNQGSRPFSKDTVGGILTNRFYAGQITDGNGGWVDAKHAPFIDAEAFDLVQELRALRSRPRLTINSRARTYSLSCIARCVRCDGSIRMQTSPTGRARVYCASRSEGLDCDFKGTFLDLYEDQIQWYLTAFIIPEDYQRRLLEAHGELADVYDDTKGQEERLRANLKRLKEQYRWGHVSRREYLSEYKDTEDRLRHLVPPTSRHEELDRPAHFLSNVAEAWQQANQEQKNRLARVLFEEVRLDSGGRAVAVKPRLELQPFFGMNWECHTKDIAGDPEGIRTPDLHRDRVAC